MTQKKREKEVMEEEQKKRKKKDCRGKKNRGKVRGQRAQRDGTKQKDIRKLGEKKDGPTGTCKRS